MMYVVGLSAQLGNISPSLHLCASEMHKGKTFVVVCAVLAHGKMFVSASDLSEWGLYVASKCNVGEPETADCECGKTWVNS